VGGGWGGFGGAFGCRVVVVDERQRRSRAGKMGVEGCGWGVLVLLA